MSTIDRRTVLRGIGTAMALPWLDAMVPSTALAQSVKAAPVRMAYLFVPNGINMAHWRPEGVGAGYKLPSTLAPLQPFYHDFNVLSGLSQMNASAGPDGPGDHARSSAVWLTGVRAKKTNGTDIRVGISADQYAAMSKVAQGSKFASLEIGCERGALAGDCDSGYSCAYSSTIAWKGESTPLPKEVSPRQVFERLFGSGMGLEDAQSRARRTQQRQSVLDFIAEDAASLKGRVGARDARKLDEYFTAVREIEARLVKSESQAALDILAGIKAPTAGGISDRGEHIRLMGDMMVLAFQADLTRVCTFMFANEGSNRAYREIGISDGHHDISHHAGVADKLEHKRQIDLYHVEQLAYILKRMKEVKEPNGTLLDNTMLLFGGGISDGNRHNHDDLPLLFAGHAGKGFQGGRHLVYDNKTPLTNLYLSMLEMFGTKMDRLGDSTGQLRGLF